MRRRTWEHRIDGRRSGSWKPLPLTGWRGKRSWLSTRSHLRVSSHVGRDRGRQRSPSPASLTVDNAAARKPPKRGRLFGSESSARRARSVGRSWGASSNATLPGVELRGSNRVVRRRHGQPDESRAKHEAVGAARKWARSGVERFVGYSIHRIWSVAEVGYGHLPRSVEASREANQGEAR